MEKLHLSDKRVLLGVLGGAIVVLLIGILALSHLGSGGKAATHPVANLPVTATATSADATATLVATQSAISPTATPKPHPLPVPKSYPPPAHNPAPPPLPPPPPATPCHAASTCVNPTPGPCEIGGAPYYLTPTVTPTTATIAQVITNAATRNGVSVQLQQAIAWQESGWHQNVVACDGGIGLMQVMPVTAAWLNSYYGANDDVYSLTGNAGLGAGYLSFYYQFYTNYLQQNDPAACGNGGCNWDTLWPKDESTVVKVQGETLTIRDIVISVYNEGAGTIKKIGINNWSYVSNVLLFYHDRYSGTGN